MCRVYCIQLRESFICNSQILQYEYGLNYSYNWFSDFCILNYFFSFIKVTIKEIYSWSRHFLLVLFLQDLFCYEDRHINILNRSLPVRLHPAGSRLTKYSTTIQSSRGAMRRKRLMTARNDQFDGSNKKNMLLYTGQQGNGSCAWLQRFDLWILINHLRWETGECLLIRGDDYWSC